MPMRRGRYSTIRRRASTGSTSRRRHSRNCRRSVRGRGLFHALELVADRATKEPFDPALQLHARVKREAMARGLLCYPMGGTIDGRRGDHVLLAPPFIAEERQLEEAVAILGAAVDAAVEVASAVTRR